MDNNMITIKCHDCGADTSVKASYYKSKPSDYIWRCKACRIEYHRNWFKNKTEEERRICHEKMSDSAKKRVAAISEEEKRERAENQSEKMKLYWASLSEEEYNNKCKIAQHNWDVMSDEQRNLQKQHVSESLKIAWSKLSDEEYQRRCYMNSVYAKLQWENRTEEDINKIRENASERFNKWWSTRTKEDLINMSIKRAKTTRDKYIRMELEPNKNEAAVINLLNINKLPWEYLWQNKEIHPDFYKLFPYNKVTGAKRVEPFHVWDIIIKLPNDGKILIDVDGSIHDPSKISRKISDKWTKNVYSFADFQKFYESMRPYKTDGNEAYAILCYDDNVRLDTDVINIKTNEMVKLSDLIKLIKSKFYDDKEIKKMANNI